MTVPDDFPKECSRHFRYTPDPSFETKGLLVSVVPPERSLGGISWFGGRMCWGTLFLSSFQTSVKPNWCLLCLTGWEWWCKARRRMCAYVSASLRPAANKAVPVFRTEAYRIVFFPARRAVLFASLCLADTFTFAGRHLLASGATLLSTSFHLDLPCFLPCAAAVRGLNLLQPAELGGKKGCGCSRVGGG